MVELEGKIEAEKINRVFYVVDLAVALVFLKDGVLEAAGLGWTRGPRRCCGERG